MSDDFTRIGGNLAYITNWLKMISLGLFVICLALTGTLVFMLVNHSAEAVIPIVINQATGDAMAVDYKIVDATGEERAPVEVRKFCEDFLSDAFTFNRFTARAHLESLANYSTPEALNQIREGLNLPRRSEHINRNAQGLFEITSFMITESRPLKTQIYFRTRIYAISGELIEETSQLAVMTIRPVRRSARNPHGLIVIEYRQNPFSKPNQEE